MIPLHGNPAAPVESLVVTAPEKVALFCNYCALIGEFSYSSQAALDDHMGFCHPTSCAIDADAQYGRWLARQP